MTTPADLAVAYAGEFTQLAGGLKLALGNGDGTFQAPQSLRSSIAGVGVACADFNRDGKLDLALAMEGPTFNWDAVIYPGQGNGSFAAPMPLNLPDNLVRGIAAVNGDRDGKPDLAVPTQGDRVLALRGLRTGTFARVAVVPTRRRHATVPGISIRTVGRHADPE